MKFKKIINHKSEKSFFGNFSLALLLKLLLIKKGSLPLLLKLLLIKKGVHMQSLLLQGTLSGLRSLLETKSPLKRMKKFLFMSP